MRSDRAPMQAQMRVLATKERFRPGRPSLLVHSAFPLPFASLSLFDAFCRVRPQNPAYYLQLTMLQAAGHPTKQDACRQAPGRRAPYPSRPTIRPSLLPLHRPQCSIYRPLPHATRQPGWFQGYFSRPLREYASTLSSLLKGVS